MGRLGEGVAHIDSNTRAYTDVCIHTQVHTDISKIVTFEYTHNSLRYIVLVKKPFLLRTFGSCCGSCCGSVWVRILRTFGSCCGSCVGPKRPLNLGPYGS